MPSTYYPVSAVGFTVDNSECWTPMQGLPAGDVGFKCSKPEPPCPQCGGTIRVLNTGEKIHYKWICDPNPATAGFIRKNTATGLIEVINWSSES